jgi:hypothetical protein
MADRRLKINLKTKVKKKIVICVAVVCGLLAARHLNTVPHREFKTGYRYWVTESDQTVYTAEDLFGSSYRGTVNGKDIGVSSKKFDDLLRLIPRYRRE